MRLGMRVRVRVRVRVLGPLSEVFALSVVWILKLGIVPGRWWTDGRTKNKYLCISHRLLEISCFLDVEELFQLSSGMLL